jgi:homoserine kinase
MKVKVFAPATVANVAVGFDILGFAVSGIGDTIEMERNDTKDVRIITTDGVTSIPRDPKKNTATIGLLKLIEDKKLNFGFNISICKGIPMGSGLGGSAASAVGAIWAANLLLDEKLTSAELLAYALAGETFASGGMHADNVAPCLWGGLNLIDDENKIIPIPYPEQLICVLVKPEVSINTKDARKILSDSLSLKAHVNQSANLAKFILGCTSNNLDLINKSLNDVIIEPQRSKLIPYFYEVKDAALNNGALGCSISGSGPTMFAFARDKDSALEIKTAMEMAFNSKNVKTEAWISSISPNGVRTLEVS